MLLKTRSRTTVDATGPDHGASGHREVVDDTQLLGKSLAFDV
jgi:hypothetical protein